MKTSANGVALIKSFEQCCLTAYPDPKTKGPPWTIGWGHTGPDVYKGLVWSQAKADDVFLTDLLQRENTVTNQIKVPLNQNQFDAMVSFTYNVGAQRLFTSTMRRKLNAGDYAGAANEFGRWISPGTVVENGLRRRRAREKALFLTPVV